LEDDPDVCASGHPIRDGRNRPFPDFNHLAKLAALAAASA
jgi:hypothetical protein